MAEAEKSFSLWKMFEGKGKRSLTEKTLILIPSCFLLPLSPKGRSLLPIMCLKANIFSNFIYNTLEFKKPQRIPNNLWNRKNIAHQFSIIMSFLTLLLVCSLSACEKPQVKEKICYQNRRIIAVNRPAKQQGQQEKEAMNWHKLILTARTATSQWNWFLKTVMEDHLKI